MSPTTSLNGMQTRKKRVLPTRTRRGGPGVGNCDVDVMILDTNKRRSENEPLVPADTPFLLTTDSAAVDELSADAGLGLNAQANERYFDRPEVLKAFREQLIIETPQFVHVADLPSVGVGGRFRPRGSGDNLIDTSDAAYEKRHRKYESFEKRLRLREKEKLKHEHYKLKERIEQLRSMDGSAFLSLPASNFSPVDVHATDAQDDDGGSDPQDVHLNGALDEGERRRKEMLNVALSLEERYRMLLPPERIRKANMSSWAEQENLGSEEKEETLKPEGESSKAREFTGIKLKFKVPSPLQNVASPPTQQTPVKKVVQVSLPPLKPSPLRHTSHYQQEEPPLTGHTNTDEDAAIVLDNSGTTQVDDTGTLEEASPSPQRSVSVVGTPVPPVSLPSTPVSNPEIAVLDLTASPGLTSVDEDDLPLAIRVASMPSTRTPKRPRLSPSTTPPYHPEESVPQASIENISVPITTARQASVPPIESINTSISAPIFVRIKQQRQKPLAMQKANQRPRTSSLVGRKEETVCMLMVAAVRSSAGTKSRNQMRHITAFGAKVPQAVDEPKEFELPSWVRGEEEEEEEDSHRGSVEQLDELNHDVNDIMSAANDTESDLGAPPMAHQFRFHYEQPKTASTAFLPLEPPIEVLDIPESSIRDSL
ncbi:hypothetical protein AX15_005521 [Amanita polypyramis BW_CC]|nr:hypothetical protein AX15_005521 [Amanita polypyramis BW_CC]